MSIQVGPSGFPFVRGNRKDFREVWAEDYNDAVALGGWESSRYAKTHSTYKRGWGDSMGKGGFPSGYDPGIISVERSCLVYNLRSAWGSVEGRASALVRWSANVGPIVPNLLYGAVEWAGWAEGSDGYKMAALFWSDSGNLDVDGEIDHPEARFGHRLNSYLHMQDSGNQQVAFENHPYTLFEKHVYRIEWTPDYVAFFVDDKRVGYYGPGVDGYNKARIPKRSMHWQVQIEAAFERKRPWEGETGKFYQDWLKVYRYESGVTATMPTDPVPVVVPSGTFVLTSPAKPDKATYAPGGELAASVAYTNDGDGPFAIRYLALALRGPNGERQDLAPAIGEPLTLAAKGVQSLGAVTRLPTDAALGPWGVVSTWQGSDGAWHESDPAPFTVAAPPPPPDEEPDPEPEPGPAAPPLPDLLPVKLASNASTATKNLAKNVANLHAYLNALKG